MELRQVMGRRRSIRYYKYWRPVEEHKLEKMLEAARRASHAANINACGCVVVDNRDDNETAAKVRQTVIQFSQVHVQQAPIWLLWFVNLARWDEQDKTLKKLIDVGALNSTHGWNYKYVDEFVVKMTKGALKADGGYAATMLDLGQAIAHATLIAYEEGLGTCLNACADVSKLLGLPDGCRVAILQTVGYPAESWEAGGQRPRADFGDIFFRNAYDSPMSLSPDVEDELRRDKLIMAEAPLPWRSDEVKALAEMFKLPYGEKK